MKKILGLSVAALLVIAMVGGGTWAFFQDTENVAGNAIQAGTLDLTIDDDVITAFDISDVYPGQVADPVEYFVLENVGSLSGTLDFSIAGLVNAESTGTTEFEDDDVNDISEVADAVGTTTTLKDTGVFGAVGSLVGYRMVVNDNDTVTITANTSDEVTFEPAIAQTQIGDTYSIKVGELESNVLVRIWVDLDKDGGFDDNSDILLTDGGTTTDVDTFNATGAWVALSSLAGDTWEDLSTMAAAASNHFYVEWKIDDDFTDDPGDVLDNTYQGDGVIFDLEFVLTQAD